MAAKSWVLTDHSANEYVTDLTLTDKDAPAATGCTVTKRTLRGGLSDGVDVVRVDNGACRFDVLPTRGMGIWRAWVGDLEIGWRSPVRGPVHPAHVPVGESTGLGWLDGFDELLVRCGLESNGAPEFDEEGRVAYPLHGRIANKPAHRVSVSIDDDTGEIAVRGSVEETRFHFLKVRLDSVVRTKPGEPGFRIEDTVVNISGSPAEIQMLYHCNFGLPLLGAGAQVVAPVKTVVPRNDHAASGVKAWPTYSGEAAGYEEQVYFLELLADDNGRTQAMLKDAHGMKAATMYFNKRQLPCFSVWKNTTSAPDGYVTGLEPGTNFPNPRTYEGEQGRVAKLDGAGSISFDFALKIHRNQAEVEAGEKEIAALQGDVKPKVFDSPQEGWCAPG